MKQEIMELLNEIGVVIAEKEAPNAISVLNTNGKPKSFVMRCIARSISTS